MLEEGRGTGAFEATQPSLARLAWIRREGRSARRVVDSEVVLIPVAPVFAQPCCLLVCEPWPEREFGEAYRDRTDEVAPRGEVQMFSCRMFLLFLACRRA
jgi:hypothetical protein